MTPDALLERPDLSQWNVVYIEAFGDLSFSRSHSETPHPIRFSDVIIYGRLKGVKESNLLFFFNMIKACDEAYLQYHRDNPPPPPEK